MFGFLQNIGTTEVIIIGLILVFLFGAKKITELGKGAGETARELKNVKREIADTIEETKKDPDSKSEKEV